MHDALGVRRREPVGNLGGVLDGLSRRHWAMCETVAKGHAVEQLGYDKRDAVVIAHVVDRENAGMTERGRGERLALEAFQSIGVTGELCEQDT